MSKTLRNLGNQMFECKKDAENALRAFKKTKYHEVLFEIEEVNKDYQKGETPSLVGCRKRRLQLTKTRRKLSKKNAKRVGLFSPLINWIQVF